MRRRRRLLAREAARAPRSDLVAGALFALMSAFGTALASQVLAGIEAAPPSPPRRKRSARARAAEAWGVDPVVDDE